MRRAWVAGPFAVALVLSCSRAWAVDVGHADGAPVQLNCTVEPSGVPAGVAICTV